MKFGYQQPSHTFAPGENTFEKLKEIARQSENQGFDSFWIMDHLLQIAFVGEIQEPIMEPYTTLAAIAASTEKIKLGALCTCNYFRNPALLAKMGATIDQISRGRFWLGLGAGWFKEEARRYGYEFADSKTRLQMLEEAVQIVEKAWTEDSPTFRGNFYRIEDYVLSPKPVQKPRPKILIGGEGEKITLRLVAKYADACNVFVGGNELKRKLSILQTHCKEVGRNYSNILKTRLASIMLARDRDEAVKKIEHFKPPWMDLKSYAETFLLGNPSDISDQVSELRDIGIDYLIINVRGKYEPDDRRKFSEDVMTRFL